MPVNTWGNPYNNRPRRALGMKLTTILFKGRDGWVWRVIRGVEQLGAGCAKRQDDARSAVRECKKAVKLAKV